MLTVHDWISGRGARVAMLDKLLAEVMSRPDVWVATVGEVAAHHRAAAPGLNDVAADIPCHALQPSGLERRVMQTWNIHKRQLETGKGIVAAQHFEAAQAGAGVLAAGGNAMDAAVVTALVLSVVETWLSGVGGGWPAVCGPTRMEPPSTRSTSMSAPAEMSRAIKYPLKGGRDGDWFDWPAVEGDRNITGYTSIGVPGAIAGFAAGLEKYGTLSWAEALRPAIDYAERGMIVDWFTRFAWPLTSPGCRSSPLLQRCFWKIGKPRKSAQNAEQTLPADAGQGGDVAPSSLRPAHAISTRVKPPPGWSEDSSGQEVRSSILRTSHPMHLTGPDRSAAPTGIAMCMWCGAFAADQVCFRP